ncbi:hypothetical protein ACFWWC_11060 [Streptomyces sp. NPDC058642]|jgi:hypothetical protein
MSFHKIAPVAKKNTKPAAPAPKKKAPRQKKAAARPVSRKGC